LNKYTKKPHNVPDFCFNIFNFEDFLILHYPKDIVLQYQKICEHENHFENPLDSKKYMPLIKKVILGYNKSSLPKNFIISKEILDNIFTNNDDADIKFRSAFARELNNIIRQSS
jgi:hypothetical protein